VYIFTPVPAERKKIRALVKGASRFIGVSRPQPA
jgi:hypothetical protein